MAQTEPTDIPTTLVAELLDALHDLNDGQRASDLAAARADAGRVADRYRDRDNIIQARAGWVRAVTNPNPTYATDVSSRVRAAAALLREEAAAEAAELAELTQAAERDGQPGGDDRG